MSDKFVFLNQFYAIFWKMTLATELEVLYPLTWSRKQPVSFHKNSEN